MMPETLIDQGLNLMLFGMGTVFVFLSILVFATSAMSQLVNRFTPADEAKPEPHASTPAPPQTRTVSPQIIKAIEEAIAAHRER